MLVYSSVHHFLSGTDSHKITKQERRTKSLHENKVYKTQMWVMVTALTDDLTVKTTLLSAKKKYQSIMICSLQKHETGILSITEFNLNNVYERLNGSV